MAETITAEVEAPEEAQASLGRRLLAEFVGTLVFVAVGTGAATVLLLGPGRALGGISQQLGGDPNQEAVFGALLGNNFGDVLAVALAFAIALSTLVYAFGGISGAHFNPAVTFSLAVSRRFRWKELPIYWIVQCIGAIAGTAIIAGLYKSPDPGGATVLFGGTVLAEGVSQWQGLLSEAFITFILVTAIMAIAVDPRAPKGWSGLVIGLALGGGILVTASVTGGSANFARSIGPFVVSALFDEAPNIPWDDLIIYAVGPLIGGAAAALVYESVTGLELVSPAPQPGAATPTTAEALVEEAHTHPADEGHPHSHGDEMHSHPHDHDSGPGHEHPH
jgi:glycerol uptake facilitator protein